jgi:hypothetical protein
MSCTNNKNSLNNNKYNEYLSVMENGKYKERQIVLSELANNKTAVVFDIVKIEFTKNTTTTLIREATIMLINIDSTKAVKFIHNELIKGSNNKRLDIIFGLSGMDYKGVIGIIEGVKPNNKREEIAFAYINCKNNINYKNNINVLIEALIDKKANDSSINNIDNAGYWIDAAFYLGKLKNKIALPALEKALKWADGDYSETIYEAIDMIKNE